MTKKVIIMLICFALLAGVVPLQTPYARQERPRVMLGNEALLEEYQHLVAGKRVGLVTNQTGVNGQGESIVDVFMAHDGIQLVALYAPEHGLDGKALAGEYVESYTHELYNIPVYSLYGATREPTRDMLADIDILLFDMQDIGARTYTYMSTLNYSMVAASKYGVPIAVLDRPNPLGGMTVEGPMMEERFISFVGVDKLPKAHGMTAGELAQFFNRKIGADLTVVPMKHYQRNMIFQDTGLPWVQTSPNIPDLTSCFGYMATGLGEGTGVFQADRFKWIGGRDIDAEQFADRMNASGLQGVEFIPEVRGSAGGVRLHITDYYSFNPARTGIHGLAHAFQLGTFNVPKSGDTPRSIVMFDKIMGTDKMGEWLEQGLSPQEIEQKYAPPLQQFKSARTQYLLDDYGPNVLVKVENQFVYFDVDPYIDENSRLLVPVRAIAEALGSRVYWNGATREVRVTKDNLNVNFTIGDSTAHVNGHPRTMDTRPVIREGRTFIPARYVSEYLGAAVTWDGNWRMVHID